MSRKSASSDPALICRLSFMARYSFSALSMTCCEMGAERSLIASLHRRGASALSSRTSEPRDECKASG